MKKKRFFADCKWSGIKKLLRIMKLTTLFLFFSVVAFAARSYSQNSHFNLSVRDASIIQVFDEIEQATDFGFLFKTDQLDLNKRYTFNIKNTDVESILKAVLDKDQYSYKIVERTIVITRDNPGELRNGVSLSVGGKVTGAEGQALPGVTVAVKGTNSGTITDADGSYSLANIPDDATLVFSFVGMKPQEIKVDGKMRIDVVMTEESIGLDEVVAVGYGTQKKVNLTGSVSSVSSQQLMERPVTNATSLLQGRVSGLHVTQPSGQPGRDDAIFYIRGLGSFGASSTPLILIDGVIGTLSDVAPNDIENISVLKDAASASIYGARAANGVILVTTKNARKGARVEYKLDVGVHEATRLPEGITNSAEYMEMSNKAYSRSGLAPLYTQQQIDAYANAKNDPQYPNFDWVDYYFSPATVVNHYLSLSNMTEKTSYKLSLNYLDQDGILPNISSKRYNAQFNLTSQITKRITLGPYGF